MVRTFVRFCKRMEEARAVRKAVSVCACRKPIGGPWGEYKVTEPVGLIVGSLGSAFADDNVTTIFLLAKTYSRSKIL